jgi:hypothetical protein
MLVDEETNGVVARRRLGPFGPISARR